MTSYIFLNQVHFFAHHGVDGQETIAGNDFIIDLRLKTDIARAVETDDVANTVSYADKGRDGHPFQIIGARVRTHS